MRRHLRQKIIYLTKLIWRRLFNCTKFNRPSETLKPRVKKKASLKLRVQLKLHQQISRKNRTKLMKLNMNQLLKGLLIWLLEGFLLLRSTLKLLPKSIFAMKKIAIKCSLIKVLIYLIKNLLYRVLQKASNDSWRENVYL